MGNHVHLFIHDANIHIFAEIFCGFGDEFSFDLQHIWFFCPLSVILPHSSVLILKMPKRTVWPTSWWHPKVPNDFEYRTIRFRNIVLYDFEYRTIRFWISFYTIWRIVTVDVRKLLMGWGEAFFWMEITPMMIPEQWAWIFYTETSVTPAVVVMFCRDLA